MVHAHGQRHTARATIGLPSILESLGEWLTFLLFRLLKPRSGSIDQCIHSTNRDCFCVQLFGNFEHSVCRKKRTTYEIGPLSRTNQSISSLNNIQY
jgi:hypothetical protein